MLLERLFNSDHFGLLESQLRFTEARHNLLVENAANAGTPGYRTKDLDVKGFERQLRERLARHEKTGRSVRFDDLAAATIRPNSYTLYHDRTNRSPEQNLAEAQKNGLKHNVYAELLRKSFGQIETALRERIG